jgi:hypothetical protein
VSRRDDLLNLKVPITSANIGEFQSALRDKLAETDPELARQLADVNARIEAARIEGYIQEALGLVPMLGFLGVPPAAAAVIGKALQAAAKVIGIAPDVIDAANELKDVP